jgi:hypothetical protein
MYRCTKAEEGCLCFSVLLPKLGMILSATH